MPIAIRAEHLTKTYRLYQRPVDRFLELFTRSKLHRVFPALEDVSFEVERGETIGLIGQNGAGKSTLLKLLCRVAQPSSGRLETHGTIASILELGTGFHPEFTGRDNAALNATILGLSAGEVREKLPAILEFSELGSFLDQPVKTYSSGMYMRLAFSVAVNVDPEILVIDEALAVGDGHFQKKCIDKVREFQDRGKTILFCSHALYFISTLCHRTIWLNHGSVERIGPSVDVVHEYETYLLEQDRTPAAMQEAREGATASPVRIVDIHFENVDGETATIFRTGEDVRLRMSIEADSPDLPIHVLVGVNRAADDMQCFSFGTKPEEMKPLTGETRYDLSILIHDLPLLRGDYALVAFVGDENAMHIYDRRDIRPAFSVAGDRYEIGMIAVRHTWELSNSPARRLARR